MTTSRTEVLVVGAGQAGLSISWYLTREGVDHVLVDSATPAHEWAEARWDNFTLVTPNWHCSLPGWTYDGDDPDGFMTRDEVVAWLDGYVKSFDPPVRTHTTVTEVRLAPDGGYVVSLRTPDGHEEVQAGQVVVATGGYHRPVVPAYARAIDPAVAQIHSQQYLNADQLPEGAVLVVGTGQSGAQIAEDLHLEGRQVHLALGTAPRVARTYRGRDCMTWLSDMGLYDTAVQQYPGGLAAREKTNHYVTGRDGGRDIDLRQFASEGMRLYGALTEGQGARLDFAPTLTSSLDAADAVYNSICRDIDRFIDTNGIDAPVQPHYEPVWRPDHEPRALDLGDEGITSIVWAIGYRPDYSWVKVGVFDGSGRPTHTRGETTVPGLFFVGLPWMHTWGSGRFLGIARDAEHVAGRLLERRGASSPVTVGS
ncbi:FAD-dependent oxidoreductase [Aeromicrobium sp. Root495]|uniref:MSMEG_0569 family flavin-dependent oxidoreductase n=1 Tax=Aeromicrobium sp. Root495 TaxID=1736550 RepID=UPI0006FD8D94|nr:MSMEG_0569 family flavin-dependent oxidoreductase [Aeromicrobium sp. Root495]KQY58473.1 FAD-dependent oxidoreductase [Aeromicrobium sp. Root495]